MKTNLVIIATALFFCFYADVNAQGNAINKNADVRLFKEMPDLNVAKSKIQDSVAKEKEFKPSVQFGSIVHMYAGNQQSGFGPGGGAARETPDVADTWNKDFVLYRARVLVGGKLSKNGSFFLETEIPSPIGITNADGTKNVKVAPIILDAQYEHTYLKSHMVVAGMQLVSSNRNGLQGAASLMANDFTYFQYPYNLFADSPLQGNFGRDLGVNMRGFFLEDKLEYRLGVFTGRNTTSDAPLRYVGRVVYNFMDADKDYYYAGTKLGVGKTIALGAGFDTQDTYSNFGGDLFIDMPWGDAGSITVNAAFAAITGGTSLDSEFTTLIPKQTTQFLELGYYFKKCKLQPWIRYERQGINANPAQLGSFPGTVTAFNDLNTASVLGGGLNYWFNGYNTNLRLSYTSWTQENTGGTSNTYGQVWLQTQFFIF